jgi:hypothetical protein
MASRLASANPSPTDLHDLIPFLTLDRGGESTANGGLTRFKGPRSFSSSKECRVVSCRKLRLNNLALLTCEPAIAFACLLSCLSQ